MSHLRYLRQATDVRVLVEKDLVGHFLPDLSLGPLLLSSRTIVKSSQRQTGGEKEKRKKGNEQHATNKRKTAGVAEGERRKNQTQL